MIVKATKENISLAIEKLNAAELVALPTETVYGLAADATNDIAVGKIYRAKFRPLYNPLIVHVAEINMAQQFCMIDDLSLYLMEKFWPGPLSLVVPLKKNHKLSSKALAGLNSVALRCPRGIFKEIISEFKRPLVAPSANKSGSISTTNAIAVAQSLKDNVKLILDGGSCSLGIESTIVKISGTSLEILRHGALSCETLQECGIDIISKNHEVIEAPGMLSSHYAPNALLRMNATEIYPKEALLAFGKQSCKNQEAALYSLNLSVKGDLEEAAHNLFNYMHILDQENIKTIAVQPIPNKSLGIAINDRLKRASFR